GDRVTLAAGARLDFDGIAKGFAVDACVARLRAAGVRRALVSLGESSIYAIGAPAGDSYWRVARGRGGRGAPGGPPARPRIRRARLAPLGGRRQGGGAVATHRRPAPWPASRGRGGGRGRFAVGHRRRGLHEGSPRVGPRGGGACAAARRDGGDPGHARRDRGG